MPIAFPPPKKYTVLNDASKLFKVPGMQVNPNLARIGSAFTKDAMDPGFGRGVALRPNVRNLGKTYAAVTSNAIVNPVINTFRGGVPYKRVMDYLNMYLTGTTRDSTEAALGNVRVMIFRTQDMAFVGEVTSDASGLWSILMLKGGPFFRVTYKVGSPDVAGTSRNDIVPVQL